ncbi:condensation domain-containing protein, partial [Zopfochytrium polystomum]
CAQVFLSGSKKEAIAQTFGMSLSLTDHSWDVLPATPLQAGMILATMKDNCAYVNQMTFGCSEEVDVSRLRNAFLILARNIDIIRTSFVYTGTDGVCQVVHGEITDAPISVMKGNLKSFLDLDMKKGFTIDERWWIRLAVVHDDRSYIVVTLHHALYDGFSLPMILNDFFASYRAEPLSPRGSLTAYFAYTARQSREESEFFWRNYLRGFVPTEFSLKHGRDFDEIDKVVIRPCSNPMSEVRLASTRASVSPAAILKTAYALLLRKYCRKNDVVFGEVFSCRDIDLDGADR